MSFLKPSVPKRFYQPNIIFETVPPTAKISHLGHMNMYTNIKKAKQNKEKTGEYRQRRKQENIFKKDGEKMRKERSEGERQEVAEEEENIIVLAFFSLFTTCALLCICSAEILQVYQVRLRLLKIKSISCCQIEK